jgi:putative transposase
MPNYRRSKINGGTWFFTLVTYKRRRILVEQQARRLLRTVIEEVRDLHPFTIDGWVLLPDHLHCVWTLPNGDHDYSKRWGLIKARFTKGAKGLFHRDEWLTDSKRKHREGTLWQRRFWEHEIRDEDDFSRHLDYLYYNPVKHGLVRTVAEWPYSTFHRDVKKGFYPQDWGGDGVTSEGNFGE